MFDILVLLSYGLVLYLFIFFIVLLSLFSIGHLNNIHLVFNIIDALIDLDHLRLSITLIMVIIILRHTVFFIFKASLCRYWLFQVIKSLFKLYLLFVVMMYILNNGWLSVKSLDG